MRQLLILVDSERSDPYLNSVVHNLRSGRVTVVTFVHVYGFPDDEAAAVASGLAKRTLTSVVQNIASLSRRAEYVDSEGVVVSLNHRNSSISSEEVKAFYSSVDNMSVEYKAQEIHYGELRKFLRNARQGSNQGLVVDLTGCRKRVIGDFIALGLVDGLDEVRTFDLLAPTNFKEPWKSLMHELEQELPRTFKYVNILETRIISDCSRVVMIRAPRLRYATTFAIILAIVGISFNWYFGLDSIEAKWVNVLAQFATFTALFFVFFPPRNA